MDSVQAFGVAQDGKRNRCRNTRVKQSRIRIYYSLVDKLYRNINTIISTVRDNTYSTENQINNIQITLRVHYIQLRNIIIAYNMLRGFRFKSILVYNIIFLYINYIFYIT